MVLLAVDVSFDKTPILDLNIDRSLYVQGILMDWNVQLNFSCKWTFVAGHGKFKAIKEVQVIGIQFTFMCIMTLIIKFIIYIDVTLWSQERKYDYKINIHINIVDTHFL